MTPRIRFTVLAMAVTIAAPSLSAQVALLADALPVPLVLPTASPRSGAVTPIAGPQLEATRAGARVRGVERARAAAVPAVPQPPMSRRRGVPQMIIGGAALVGGAIIGDDVGTIVMLGGLGYGLYGLYLYLH